MDKRAIFSGKALPYMLLLPQLAITIIFFYWPATQAVWQSFLLEDAFGLSSEFVGFERFAHPRPDRLAGDLPVIRQSADRVEEFPGGRIQRRHQLARPV